MKTALQILITRLEYNGKHHNDPGVRAAFMVSADMAMELLSEEKDRMFHSFYAGAGSDDKTDHEDQFNKYYEQTFKQ